MLPGGRRELNPAQGCEASVDPFVQVAAGRGGCECGFENLAGFCLHSVAVPGCADTQALFDAGWEIADADTAGHVRRFNRLGCVRSAAIGRTLICWAGIPELKHLPGSGQRRPVQH